VKSRVKLLSAGLSTIRGQILDVDMRQGKTTYRLREGTGLTIAHKGRDVALTTGNAVTLAC
jgi:hypothetical protein